MLLSVIIPVFNEKKTILEILKRIQDVNLEPLSFAKQIIIVDDASNDGTRQILESLEGKYKIVYQPRNQGKGAAIRAGLRQAEGDYVIIQDADLEYDPQDYKKILECALNNRAQAVYGSRRLVSQNKYSHRSFYWGGIFLTWVANLLYGTNITDESTGYKFFKTDFLKSLPLVSRGFELEPEITAKIAKRGIKIYEVPIRYYPRPKNEGKKIKWKDGLVALWTLIKYKFVD